MKSKHAEEKNRRKGRKTNPKKGRLFIPDKFLSTSNQNVVCVHLFVVFDLFVCCMSFPAVLRVSGVMLSDGIGKASEGEIVSKEHVQFSATRNPVPVCDALMLIEPLSTLCLLLPVCTSV